MHSQVRLVKPRLNEREYMIRGTTRHPKTLDLASRLKITGQTATGILQSLWDYTAEWSPQGNIGKFSDELIADAVGWIDYRVKRHTSRKVRTKTAAVPEIINALVDARWLDRDPEHRLLIHDWSDHCGRATVRRLQRAGLGFAKPGGGWVLTTGETAAKDDRRDRSVAPDVQGDDRSVTGPSHARDMAVTDAVVSNQRVTGEMDAISYPYSYPYPSSSSSAAGLTPGGTTTTTSPDPKQLTLDPEPEPVQKAADASEQKGALEREVDAMEQLETDTGLEPMAIAYLVKKCRERDRTVSIGEIRRVWIWKLDQLRDRLRSKECQNPVGLMIASVANAIPEKKAPGREQTRLVAVPKGSTNGKVN